MNTTQRCEGTGQPLPADARADFEADPTCTHHYCPACGKLLRLPRTPDGTVRAHAPAPADAWPFDAYAEHETGETTETLQ